MAAEPESPEIFDDLYLGLRAGGALRKQRRGEPLTSEEQEVLGRWNRLSLGRKALAVGAYRITPLAADAAGNHSSARQVAIKVVKP